jgi:hypothetical protein
VNAGRSVLGRERDERCGGPTLQELRRRLAASENLEVITDVRRATRRFAERADLREAFAMLVAGVMRSGGASAPLRRRSVRRLPPAVRSRCRPGSR